MSYARCLACWAEFNEAYFTRTPPPQCCPNCESRSIPALISDDVTVSINWQALRILVMWAENWDDKHIDDRYGLRTVRMIAEKLEEQQPDLAKRLPLTLAGEIGQIRDHFGAENVEVHGIDMEDE